MTGFNKPDYEKAYCLATRLLVDSNEVFKFPYSIKRLIKELTDLNCCSYEKAETDYDIEIRQFGSNSAVWQEYNGMNIVFYNGKENTRRVRFSFAHELAHFMMNHDTNIPAGDEYDRQETEANTFAAQILMPFPIIHEMEENNIVIDEDVLIKCFDVSGPAAENRMKTLSKLKYEWLTDEQKKIDRGLMKKFQQFTEMSIQGILASTRNGGFI